MKKNKLYLAFFALLSLVAFSFVLTSCNLTEAEYKIEGVPTELVLKASDTAESFDFLEGITATADGKPVDLKVDTSKIVFGTKGTYEVTFSAGEETKTIPVKIYDMPTAEVTDLTVSYKDVKSSLGTGIKVMDSFGVELEVEIDETSIAPNGYYQSGDLSFTATDRAGNVYTGTQKVVVELKGGETLEQINVDLSNVSVQIPISSKLMTATLDGIAIAKQHVVQSGSNVIITGNYIKELGVGDYDLVLYLENNYVETTLAVLDTELPRFVVGTETNKEGINNYIFVKGEEMVLPTPKLATNSYQDLRFDTKLFLNDVEIALESFDYNKAGKYTLEVIGTKVNDETKSITIRQDFYIVIKEAALTFFDPVVSNQTAQLWNTRTDIGSNISRVKETYSGEDRYAMKYVNNATILDDTRSLYLNNAIIEQALNSGARTLTFDVMFHEIPEGSTASVTLMSTSVGYWVATRGIDITEVDNWISVSFDLDSAFVAGLAELNGQYHVYEEDAYGNLVMRFDEFEVLTSCTYVDNNGEHKNKPHEAFFSNFRFGYSNSIAKYTGTYMTADQSKTAIISNNPNSPLTLIDSEASVTYPHAFIAENGLVLASMTNANLTYLDDVIGVVSNFWFDIDGVRYYKQLDSLSLSVLVEQDYTVEELLNISNLDDSISFSLVEGNDYAQFLENTLVGLVAGEEVVLRLTYEDDVYVDIMVTILSVEEFYDRPFNSPEFTKYFKTNFAGNYVEYDAAEEAIKLAQRSPEQDDSRGFFLDRDYLFTMRELGYNFISFKVKHKNLVPSDSSTFDISMYQFGDEPEYLYQGSRWNWRNADFKTFTQDIYIDVTYNLLEIADQFNGNKTSIIFLKHSQGDIWVKDLTFTKTVDYTDKNNWFSTSQGTITYNEAEDKFTVKGTGSDIHFFLSSDVVSYYLEQGFNTITLTIQNSNWQGNGETWKGFQIIGKELIDGEIHDKWGYINVNVVTSELTQVTIDLLDAGNIWTEDVNFYTNKCEATDLYIYGMEFRKSVDPLNKHTWFESAQGKITYDEANERFIVQGYSDEMHFFLSSEVVQYYIAEGYTSASFIVTNSNWQATPETWKGFQIIGKELVDDVVQDKWGYINPTPVTTELKEVVLDFTDPGNIWTMDVNFYTNCELVTDLYISNWRFNKPIEPVEGFEDKNTWFVTEQGEIAYDAQDDKFTVSGTGNDIFFYLSSEVIQHYIADGYTTITLKVQNSNWQNTPETFMTFQVVARTLDGENIVEKWAYKLFQPLTSEIKEIEIDLLDTVNNNWSLDLMFYADKCADTDLLIYDMEFNKPADYSDKSTWFTTEQGTITYDADEDMFTVVGTGDDMHFYLASEVVQHYISEGYTTLTFIVNNVDWDPQYWKGFQIIGKQEADGNIVEKWGYIQVTPVTNEMKQATIDLLATDNIWTLDVNFYTNQCQNADLQIINMTFNKPAV